MRMVAGSFNYTEPANEYNDENIFVLGSTHAEVEGGRCRSQPLQGAGGPHEAGDRTNHLAQ